MLYETYPSPAYVYSHERFLNAYVSTICFTRQVRERLGQNLTWLECGRKQLSAPIVP